MDVKRINRNQSFEGNVIVKGTISKSQNYLFNLHRPELERMVKDLPFNIFVEQSKSKKTIKLSYDVKDTFSYVVRKNEQNFVQTAGYLIENSKQKLAEYQVFLKANKLLDYKKLILTNIIYGNYKQARFLEKEFATFSLENFDIYKKVPILKVGNVNFDLWKRLFIKSLMWKMYKLFSLPTKDEKALNKLYKAYLKDLASQNKKVETVTIDFPMY